MCFSLIRRQKSINGPFVSRESFCPTIILWTWQGIDFFPPFYPVYRSKSEFLIHKACPDIHQAYAELDELLSLPANKREQFIWCYTTESWCEPWRKRYLWPIDVPQEKILAYVDSPIREHLIGSKSVPNRLREQWRQELYSQRYFGKQFPQEMERKEHEYHDSFPSRKECLEKLLIPTSPGEDVLALVPVPIDTSWIRPSNCCKARRLLKR
jgi:hypothetical protein